MDYNTLKNNEAELQNEVNGLKQELEKLKDQYKKYEDLEMVSFTDHNRISIDVYKEFYSRKINIKLIPGIEVDVKLDNSSNVKHLIVYFNLNETNFEEFAKSLNEFLDKKVPIEIEKLPEKLEFIQNIKIPEDKNPNLIFFLISLTYFFQP